MRRKNFNILMVGVGGQGIITASNILSTAAMIHGLDVKKSEIHGMSQRGGSVSSHVRFGPSVYSPVISRGEADILLSLEEMETLRWLAYANRKTVVAVCRFRIRPAAAKEYPAQIEDELQKACPELLLIDPERLSGRIADKRFFNTALLGFIAPLLEIPNTAWEQAVAGVVPWRFLEQNLAAFAEGGDYYKTFTKEVTT